MFIRGLARQLTRLAAFATGAVVGQRLFGSRTGLGPGALEIAGDEFDSIGMAIASRTDARVGRFVLHALVAWSPPRLGRDRLPRRRSGALRGGARLAG